jgi:SAM-dependent methyltransferase
MRGTATVEPAKDRLSGSDTSAEREAVLTGVEQRPSAVRDEGANDRRYSYTSMHMGVVARCRELFSLARVALGSQSEGAVRTVRWVGEAKRLIFERTNVRIGHSKILEIGPGQQLRHMRCLAVDNDVVGIDTDPIRQSLRVSEILEMARSSPWMRTIKSLGRAALRQDARFKAAMARELGVDRFPELSVLRMSATKMTFADGSFDLVLSCSVLEHIDDSRAALEEVVRVLRPGGVAFISLHLYTSHSGQHDPKIFAQGRPVAPLWPHLRPEHAHSVGSSAFLNRMRLDDWRKLFGSVMPGVEFVYERDEDDLAVHLAGLRTAGELPEFTDEELLTVNLVALWKKPPSAQAAAPTG